MRHYALQNCPVEFKKNIFPLAVLETSNVQPKNVSATIELIE